MDPAECQRLKEELEGKKKTKNYQKIAKHRNSLPMSAEMRREVAKAVQENEVVIVSGETGSGKSTQVPQLILEDRITSGEGSTAFIVCTQPRRLSATSLARRVAWEMQSDVGDLVGYAIRSESRRSPRTRILFTTTGYLLRLITSGDLLLSSVCTHLILDEVHERTQEIDLLLALLKQKILPTRNRRHGRSSPLKVVLMSATAEVTLFSSYFDHCPIVVVPGKMYPVQHNYLEDVLRLLAAGGRSSPSSRSRQAKPKKGDAIHAFDVELCTQLIHHINRNEGPGAILVFVAGAAQISKLMNSLHSGGSGATLHVLGLHSSMEASEQEEVFKAAPGGKRKVVIATNIAETSVTIPDVVYVIDSGRANVLDFDQSRSIVRLQEKWVSQANVRQRRGRAGRCQPGIAYSLYSRAHFETKMETHEMPEILRIPIHQVCLQILFLQFDLHRFLSQMINPPTLEHREAALRVLKSTKALAHSPADRHLVLTPLGIHLALLPVDIHLGKLLIFSSLLGCVDPILSVAAFMGTSSPFRRSAIRKSPTTTSSHRTGGRFDNDGSSDDEDDDDDEEVEDPEKEAEKELERKKMSFRCPTKSDLLSLANVYARYATEYSKSASAARRFCHEWGLSYQVLEEVRKTRNQLSQYLETQGFEIANHRASDLRVCNAVIAAGLWPNIIRVKHPNPKYITTLSGAVESEAAAQTVVYTLKDRSRVFLHPQSLYFSESKFQTGWLTFFELAETSKLYVRDVNMVWPYALLLFGADFKVLYQDQSVLIDDWIQFNARPLVAYLVAELRKQLDLCLLQKFRSPSFSVSQSPLISAIVELLKTDGFVR